MGSQVNTINSSSECLLKVYFLEQKSQLLWQLKVKLVKQKWLEKYQEIFNKRRGLNLVWLSKNKMTPYIFDSLISPQYS